MSTDLSPDKVDLAAEALSSASSPVPSFKGENTNIEHRREHMRGILALILVGLLTVTVLLALGAVMFRNYDTDTMDRIKDVLAIVLGPVVGLVGAVTGFYFGEQSRKEN